MKFEICKRVFSTSLRCGGQGFLYKLSKNSSFVFFFGTSRVYSSKTFKKSFLNYFIQCKDRYPDDGVTLGELIRSHDAIFKLNTRFLLSDWFSRFINGAKICLNVSSAFSLSELWTVQVSLKRENTSLLRWMTNW